MGGGQLGNRVDRTGAADGDRVGERRAELVGELASDGVGARAVVGRGQHQGEPALERSGQPVAHRRDVLDRAGAATPVRAVQRYDVHREGLGQIGTETAGTLDEGVGVLAAGASGAEQVVDELAADAVLRLDATAQAEHQQRGDERGPLDDPLVGVVEWLVPLEDQRAEVLLVDRHRDDRPEGAVARDRDDAAGRQ